MNRASLLMRPASSTSWTPRWPTSGRCASIVLACFLCMHALLMPAPAWLRNRFRCRTVRNAPHLLRDLRVSCLCQAVRLAACVQVLNCIDYLHKFGYSKEQVGNCYHDVSGVRHIPNTYQSTTWVDNPTCTLYMLLLSLRHIGCGVASPAVCWWPMPFLDMTAISLHANRHRCTCCCPAARRRAASPALWTPPTPAPPWLFPWPSSTRCAVGAVALHGLAAQ